MKTRRYPFLLILAVAVFTIAGSWGGNAFAEDTGQSFQQYGFGFAIGATAIRHISVKTDENGIVRATNDSPYQTMPMLELHKFFHFSDSKIRFWDKDGSAKDFGMGPFIAIGADSSVTTIPVIAFGGMMGWKLNNDPNSGLAFNIGLGVVLDTKATELADGLKLDEKLPDGVTSASMKETSKVGGLFIASFSF